MRKMLLFFIFSITVCGFSQNKQVLYNFTAIPQSLMTNPGSDVAYKWYFGVPLLSGISTHVSSSGFSAYDLFANNGVDFNDKLRQVLLSTSSNDRVAINEQLEVFSGGFRVGTEDDKAHVSFGMYQEFDMLSYVPKDIALLAIDGNKDYLGKSFNLGDLNAKADLLSVFHIGYTKNVRPNLILGARAKIYSSIFNATSTNNSGYIYTIPSNSNVYDQVIYSNLQLHTSGITKYDDEDDDTDIAKDIRKKAFLGGNLGLGFDFGFTYYPQKNLQITASAVDIGFIKHSKEVETFRYKGFYQFNGVLPNFNGVNQPNDAFQEFKDAIPLDTLYNKYTTWRPAKFNSSIQYSFEEEKSEGCNCQDFNAERMYKSAVGAQLFVMTTPRTPLVALTTYYRRKVFNSLEIKATYTLDSYSFANLGLGLSSKFGPVNFYVLADNLLEYKDVSKANSLSFQLGFNVIFKEEE